MAVLRVGTRGSQLALHQARAVASLLKERTGTDCEIVVIKTSGDRLAEAPLAQIGGKRLFVKEIEDALLEKTIDLAVHSSKDMPVVLPDGLEVGGVLPREEPNDAIVLPGPPPETLCSLEAIVAHLGQSPRIGTSSVRRTAQLTRILPGARFLPIRGNLDTRLRKLDAGEFDAIVLASAGLRPHFSDASHSCLHSGTRTRHHCRRDAQRRRFARSVAGAHRRPLGRRGADSRARRRTTPRRRLSDAHWRVRRGAPVDT